ncbi:hypothetical protein AYI68_g4265, partial [Smittium mucronatum]
MPAGCGSGHRVLYDIQLPVIRKQEIGSRSSTSHIVLLNQIKNRCLINPKVSVAKNRTEHGSSEGMDAGRRMHGIKVRERIRIRAQHRSSVQVAGTAPGIARMRCIGDSEPGRYPWR